MKVQEIMVKEVKVCHPRTNLSEAAKIMWANDCGSLPVVESDGTVVGMITDRDIALALGTRNRAPAEMAVFDVKPDPRELYSCRPDDDIHAALKIMREQGVRRLPVVNGFSLRGILCLNEVTLKAGKRGELSYDDVVDTLKAISEHQLARQAVPA